MDCFPDFCLGCDNQATDGLYCSETCRMADLERSGSTPSSPVHIPNTNPYQLLLPNNQPSPTMLVKSTSMTSFSPRAGPRQHSQSVGCPSTQTSPHRVLSPSSSRSSLISHASQASSNTSHDASEQTARQLSSYFNSFDRTRDQRRKSVPVHKTSAASETIHSFAEKH